ncbi:hypothetical protein BJ878DRAFT_411671 [Calycina marina]|uniref:ER transporter 6TM N-terminal domain-containing protein n=1 Tax=Calycina marina TaxID=1763456 RepID=A0A9P7ZBX0_9HELO|nr:hypothetical protein BJ878DRAFT_411671 [Calycina marina]
MPRAKYFQTLILNILGVCIGSAVGLLGLWSAVQARLNTATVGSTSYNSSQSAVCAIWLFANTWLANLLRAKMPALMLPVMIYSIFTNIAFTFGPIFTTFAQAEALIKQLLIAFFTAFGISTAVNLFVIPVSSRTVVFKDAAGYIGLVRATLKAQNAYFHSLESSDMFSITEETKESEKALVSDTDKKKDKNQGKKQESKSELHPADSPQSKALKKAIAGLIALHGKLHEDIQFAKREMAWGKLDAADIDELFALFRGVIIPLIGMSTISDIFERISERRGWIKPRKPHAKDSSEAWEHSTEKEKASEKKTWNDVMKALHEPFSTALSAMDQGLEHAGVVLEILPAALKKKKGDEEEGEKDPVPGDAEYSKFMDEQMLSFYSNRGKALRAWAKAKGLSEEQFDSASTPPPDTEDCTPDEAKHRRDQQQLYLILYMEHLLFSAGTAVSALVKFADKKVADGAMKKKHLVVPGQKRLRKWVMNIGHEDSTVNTETPGGMEGGMANVYMGSGYNPKKDPEHLPAKNAWETFGNGLRTIPRLLGSTESSLGFRVACATLTIGIAAYLEATQAFFFKQRLVWAMIIIAIGMTMTSGQSMLGFFGRLAGTTIAMITSLVIWYIVDERTPGIIVMLWLFIFLEMYFFLKYPRFLPVWLVAMVTQVLIIGYELQVQKIGIAASSASGQPYYPTYELAPYRLATVAGGSFIAFIWTVFPYPISDRSWLRKDLGSTLFLLSNYYSIIHTTIVARLHDTEGDMKDKSSPGRRLKKVRHKIFNKLTLIVPSLQQHAEWQKWEISIGGKFPRDTYDAIALRANNITNYLSLMGYATEAWTKKEEALFPNTTSAGRREWLNDLTALIDSVSPTSHQITSILSLLSSSVKQGIPLPAHLSMPEPYNLSRRLEALDKGILDSRHVEEPGYSAYAVLQVASSLVIDDIIRLVDHVKDLVGETDFTFTVNHSFDSVGSDSTQKGKRD